MDRHGNEAPSTAPEVTLQFGREAFRPATFSIAPKPARDSTHTLPASLRLYRPARSVSVRATGRAHLHATLEPLRSALLTRLEFLAFLNQATFRFRLVFACV